MALVVHEQFTLKGRPLKRGEVLFGDDADAVARNPIFARKCSAVPDDTFAELNPANAVRSKKSA